jgi:hypothetical protein
MEEKKEFAMEKFGGHGIWLGGSQAANLLMKLRKIILKKRKRR